MSTDDGLAAEYRRRRRGGGRGGYEPRPRIVERERRAWELSVRGWTQREIAHELGVSQAAVSKILQRVEARVAGQITEDRRRHKLRIFARLEHLYRESQRAWEASQAESRRQRQRRTDAAGEGTGPTTVELTVETRAGDARFLREARELLTLIVQVTSAPDQPPGEALATVDAAPDYSRLTDDELDLMIQLVRKTAGLPPEENDRNGTQEGALR